MNKYLKTFNSKMGKYTVPFAALLATMVLQNAGATYGG